MRVDDLCLCEVFVMYKYVKVIFGWLILCVSYVRTQFLPKRSSN